MNTNYIDPLSIEQLTNETNIIDVVRHYEPSFKISNNGDIKACCPFHDEKTASFSVSNSMQIFNCFGCGKGGNALAFVSNYAGLEFKESVIELASITNFDLKFKEWTEEERKAHQEKEDKKVCILELNRIANDLYIKERLNLPDNNPIDEHLFDLRQLDAKTIALFQIGWTPGNLVQPYASKNKISNTAIDAGLLNNIGKDFFYNRITFPIHDHTGCLVGFSAQTLDPKQKAKYLNSKTTATYNKSGILFGLHLAGASIRKKGYSIVTEGNYDVVSAHRLGFPNTVAPCGTAFTKEQAQLLLRYSKSIVFAFDNDIEKEKRDHRNILQKAGDRGLLKALQVAIPLGFKCKVAVFPDGCDLDDACRQMEWNELANTLDFIQSDEDAIEHISHKLLTEAKGMHQVALAINKVASLIRLIDDPTLRAGYSHNIYPMVNKANGMGKRDFSVLIKDKSNKPYEGIPFNEGAEFLDNLPFPKNGQTFIRKKDEGGTKRIANFTMKVLFHVSGKNTEEAYRVIQLQNIHNQKNELHVHTDKLSSAELFKKLIDSLGKYTWYGDKFDLNKWMDKLKRDEQPTEIIEVLGQFEGDKYAFSNAIIHIIDKGYKIYKADESGIVNIDGNYYLIPYCTKRFIDNPMYENQRRFTLVEPHCTWKDWIKLYQQVHGDNGKIALVWVLSALFFDQIHLLDIGFPILNLYGKPSSGKGSLANSILALFGRAQKITSLEVGSTPTGLLRRSSQIKNGVVAFDEYKNSINRKLIGFLKSIWDRLGKEMGTKDSSIFTKHLPINSAAIVMGQEMPTIDNALFMRGILAQFFVSKRTKKEDKLYDKLKALQQKGLSHFIPEILKHRKEVCQLMVDALPMAKDIIRDKLQDVTVDSRYLTNYGIILAMHGILSKHLDLFNEMEFEKLIIKNIRAQTIIGSGNDDVSGFWTEVEAMFMDNRIKEGEHFMIQNGELNIRLQHINPGYEQFRNMRGHKSFLSGDSLREYLKNSEPYIGDKKKSYQNGIRTTGLSFYYEKLNIQLIRFKHTGEGDETLVIQDKLERAYPGDTDKHNEILKAINNTEEVEVKVEDLDSDEGKDDLAMKQTKEERDKGEKTIFIGHAKDWNKIQRKDESAPPLNEDNNIPDDLKDEDDDLPF